MAKDGKHVIHAGGVFHNPLLNREGSAAADTQPGTVGYFNAGKFTASASGDEAAILYVANFDYLRCMTVDDPIPTGELVVSIQPMPGLFLNVRAEAGKYSKGQPVSVSNGRIKLATGEAVAFAYVEEDQPLTAAAGDLVRVVFK